jgi:hypothetical protein
VRQPLEKTNLVFRSMDEASLFQEQHGSVAVWCFRGQCSARWQATEQVIALVKRSRGSLGNVDAASVNADSVFHHPTTQPATLKAAREHIDKAIEIMQHKWGQ